MPADIVGTRVWRPSREEFDIEWGPVFANLVLADEINRAPAKVQSALLEVMAERHVSIAGQTRPTPTPFLVLATQNPIESEGVYALPEAQRDRFLMQIVVDQPSYVEELEIARRMGVQAARSHADADDRAARRAPEARSTTSSCTTRCRTTRSVSSWRPATPSVGTFPRSPAHVGLGASPRATLGLLAAGRALALLRGRRFLVPQDVADVAPEILRHRLILTYDALADGVTTDDVIGRVLVDDARAAGDAPPGERLAGHGMNDAELTADAEGVAPVARKAAELRRLELLVTRRLDGLLRGEFLGRPERSRFGGRRRPVVRSRRRLALDRLEPHRAFDRARRSARPRPTASCRRGRSSIARRA